MYKDTSGDWMNVQQPCPFLEKKTNMVAIYAIRPVDCGGFPYLNKQKMNHCLQYESLKPNLLSGNLSDGGEVESDGIH